MGSGQIVPIILMVLLVLAVIVMFVIQREKARVAALQQIGAQMGFTWEEKVAGLPEDALSEMHLFRQGRHHRSRNILRGDQSSETHLFFDYSYTRSSGQSSHTTTQSVVAFGLPETRLPAFELRPENLFHRLGEVLGFQDIDFEHDPEFSQRYLLKGADAEAVRRLFSDYLREHLKRLEDWNLEGDGRWLIAYRHGKKVRPEQLRAHLEEAHTLLQMLTASR